MSNAIHIVCASDDRYALMVCALLSSIQDNYRHREEIIFHIIDNGIRRPNKKRILASVFADNLSIRWMKIDESHFNALHPNADQFKMTAHYARFLIPYLMDKTIERVIYLDCDTIVLGDIGMLWEVDLENNVLAAARDQTANIGDSWLISNGKELGLNPLEKYFNSGVLVMDLKRWRQENLTTKLIQCTLDNQDNIQCFDQYAFNVVFHKKWTELPSAWNHMQTKPFIDGIHLIHYVAWEKPILKTSWGPYHHYFYKYLDKAGQGSLKPYLRLRDVVPIKDKDELPLLLQRLNLTYHPELSLNHQGIVVEPEEGGITKLLLEKDKELNVVRLFLVRLLRNFAKDTAHAEYLEEKAVFKMASKQLNLFGHRVSFLKKTAIEVTSSLAMGSYSLVYVDMDDAMENIKNFMGNLIRLLHYGGIMCGSCTQTEPLEKEDFDIFKFYDLGFDYQKTDIRIHKEANRPNRWFWYFIREY